MPPTRFRFGPFQLDTRERRLTRDAEAVSLTPKVFDTLEALVRQAGRLVTKEELLAAIWPDTTVEEANLTVNVSALRKLLTIEGVPTCIETVPRRGYRFALPVQAEAGSTPASDDRPASPRAYELYVRANQAAYEADHWETARDLYAACLDEAPDFAPAWARVARCHRVIAKYTSTRALRDTARAQAEAAFERALALDPALTLTHSLYAQLEVDLGRAPDAVARLLGVLEAHGPEAGVFAALVHALRFCGLLHESQAAHGLARSLDPSVITSVAHTCWLLGDYEGALAETTGDIGYMPGLALASLGREADAVAALRWRERETRDNRARAFLVSLSALLEDRRDDCLAALARAGDALADPEALYYVARTYARLGERRAALEALARVVDGGFHCAPAFAADPWLAALAGDAEFSNIVDRAERGRRDAAERFASAGGLTLVAARTG